MRSMNPQVVVHVVPQDEAGQQALATQLGGWAMGGSVCVFRRDNAGTISAGAGQCIVLDASGRLIEVCTPEQAAALYPET